MVESTILTVFLGIVAVVIGGSGLLIGLVLLASGASSARNLAVALAGSETAVADVDTDADATTVKLEATVKTAREPVETADGRDVPLYRFRAVHKNQWNRFKKRRKVRQLLGDRTALASVVLADGDGDGCLLTADETTPDRRWGMPNDSDLLSRKDFVTSTWTARETYTGSRRVPRRYTRYLDRQFDADTDFDLSKWGVGLAVSEAVVEPGDTVRIAGKVQPDTERVRTADGTYAAPTLNLTPSATLTTESWGWLAREHGKAAVLRIPVGVVALVGGPLAAYLLARNAGIL